MLMIIHDYILLVQRQLVKERWLLLVFGFFLSFRTLACFCGFVTFAFFFVFIFGGLLYLLLDWLFCLLRITQDELIDSLITKYPGLCQLVLFSLHLRVDCFQYG